MIPDSQAALTKTRDLLVRATSAKGVWILALGNHGRPGYPFYWFQLSPGL